MYESFFGMEHTPFVRDVPPEKLFESNAFRETLGRLAYVADRQMFAVVTADSGCGKSTLIRRFYSELPKEDYIILYLSEYYGAAEPPVRCGESHLSGLTEPPHLFCY